MNDRLTRWAKGLLAYTVLVILWGAWVRVTGSGAGCADHWPLCNGEWIPRADRVETLIEFTHRLTSSLAGVGSLVVLWLSRKHRPAGDATRAAAVWGLVFMLLEGAIGAALVKLELVDQNASMLRAVAVGAHLANTLLLLGAQTLTVHFAMGGRGLRLRGQGWVGAGLFACVVLTILVASSGAVTALGDTLFPADSLAHGIAQDLDPTAHVLIKLRVLHPLLAIATGGFLLFFANYVRYAREGWHVARWSWAVNGLFLTQVALGILNLLLLAPGWLQIVHLLLADVLWIALVMLVAHTLSHEPSPGTQSTTLAARTR